MKRKSNDRKTLRTKLALCKETIRELTPDDFECADGAHAVVDPVAGAETIVIWPSDDTMCCC
jgi:hypothetical protein